MNQNDADTRGRAALALAGQASRILTIAVLVWAALTTGNVLLAVLAWTLAALYTLRTLLDSADGAFLRDQRPTAHPHRPPQPYTSRTRR
ncbi:MULTISPECIES: hypothetical protein [Nonomuraea]|uniref:CDP-alcohol phosphatidyltransferase family protein n=1 Tax=Nonomuraea africana TaxID=46171 RepID=A0ABR9KY46_9ACTN|nr:hypothetical protein [Nonomuraea africana]MBE1566533.1 hypothetical protein [Nonomuraea africana]